MKKYAIFINMGRSVYRLLERSDQSMFTLFLFLGDGLGTETYMHFLQDKNSYTLQGNVCEIVKRENIVTINIDDNIIPNLDPFVTSVNNLMNILQEYIKFKELGVNKIELVLENDNLTITGH